MSIKVIMIIFLILIFFKNIQENFTNRLYLSGPTKCFSCERDLINRYGFSQAYRGQPTKCFSCEKQIVHNRGAQYGVLAQPTKCFSCEKDLLHRSI